MLLGKPLAALGISTLLRLPLRDGLPVAIVLSQIGEFSFIVASLGNSLGLLTRDATQTLVAAAIVSITLNPILYKAGQSIVRRLPATPRTALTSETQRNETADARERAVVIGYGPVGRTVTRLLQENGIEVSILEMNVVTVRTLQAEGIRAVYGDGNAPDALDGRRRRDCAQPDRQRCRDGECGGVDPPRA